MVLSAFIALNILIGASPVLFVTCQRLISSRGTFGAVWIVEESNQGGNGPRSVSKGLRLLFLFIFLCLMMRGTLGFAVLLRYFCAVFRWIKSQIAILRGSQTLRCAVCAFKTMVFSETKFAMLWHQQYQHMYSLHTDHALWAVHTTLWCVCCAENCQGNDFDCLAKYCITCGHFSYFQKAILAMLIMGIWKYFALSAFRQIFLRWCGVFIFLRFCGTQSPQCPPPWSCSCQMNSFYIPYYVSHLFTLLIGKCCFWFFFSSQPWLMDINKLLHFWWVCRLHTHTAQPFLPKNI